MKAGNWLYRLIQVLDGFARSIGWLMLTIGFFVIVCVILMAIFSDSPEADIGAEVYVFVFWSLWAVGFVLIGILGAITLWFSAIKRDGVAKGGTLGLIPSSVFLISSALFWPIYAVIAWCNRIKLTAYYMELLAVR